MLAPLPTQEINPAWTTNQLSRSLVVPCIYCNPYSVLLYVTDVSNPSKNKTKPPAPTDSGGATMRAIIGTVVLESSSHVWKILTAIGVISDRTSGYWDGRVFFPLAEGSYMLPSAIVISVWLDVAKVSMSRAKVLDYLYCISTLAA